MLPIPVHHLPSSYSFSPQETVSSIYPSSFFTYIWTNQTDSYLPPSTLLWPKRHRCNLARNLLFQLTISLGELCQYTVVSYFCTLHGVPFYVCNTVYWSNHLWMDFGLLLLYLFSYIFIYYWYIIVVHFIYCWYIMVIRIYVLLLKITSSKSKRLWRALWWVPAPSVPPLPCGAAARWYGWVCPHPTSGSGLCLV